MFRFFIAFVFLITSLFSWSQNFNRDIDMIPRPDMEIYQENLTHGIVHKRARLRTKYSLTNEHTDTLKIEIFNEKGEKTVSVGFDQMNYSTYQRNSFTQFNFGIHGLIESETNYSGVKTWIVKKKYANNGTELEIANYTIRKGDTTAIIFKKKAYDASNNLTQTTLYSNTKMRDLFKKPGSITSLKYNAENQLIQHISDGLQGNYKPTTQYYYTQKLLDSIVVYYDYGDSTKRGAHWYFQYNEQEQLIHKEESSNPSEIRSTYYQYQDDQLVFATELLNGDTLVAITFSYLNGQIYELNAIQGNLDNISNLCYLNNYNIKEMRQAFEWDKSGYLKEIKEYHNGVLKEKEEYIFEYF